MEPKLQSPELLLPAGNLEKLKIGLLYGGDAFYMGYAPFSLRANTNAFSKDDLLEGVNLIRKAGKTFYLTLNIYPRSEKIDFVRKHIDFVRKEIKPDALIVSDPGVFDMVREYYPSAIIHMSVQSNILNYRAVNFWKKQGASRIILPRELTLKDIKDIHEKVPGMELEFFVHGAICMAYSGRCLLSNYMTGRDSNQGACSHSCRWKYKVLSKQEKEKLENSKQEKDYIFEGEDKEYYLEEEKRKGEFYKIEEDEKGTYFMNSKDNCMLPYLKDLVDAGICSFKIEGRNKSEYYLATVAKVYRKVIDDMMEGKDFDTNLMDEIYKVANRGFIPGYLFGFPGGFQDIYYESSSPKQNCKFIGMITGKKGEDLYEISIRNRLDRGEEVEIFTPKEQFFIKVEKMFDLDGNPVEAVHGGAGNKILKLKKGLEYGGMLRSTAKRTSEQQKL